MKIKIDDESLKRDLKKFTQALNKEASESIIEIAQISTKQLAMRIEPYGLTGKAKDISERAIYKDISKVYWTNGQTYNQIKKIDVKLAHAYAAAINDNNPIRAEEIADKAIKNFSIAPLDNGEHLEESRRTSRRRVSKASPVNVGDDQALERFKAAKVLTGGTAKAGFLQAGESLGSKFRIQKWLKKAGGLGTSLIKYDGWKTLVTITNHCSYASEVLSETKIQQAIRNAYTSQIKRLEKQIEALAKKV